MPAAAGGFNHFHIPPPLAAIPLGRQATKSTVKIPQGNIGWSPLFQNPGHLFRTIPIIAVEKA